MALSDREKAIFDNLINGLEKDIADPVVEQTDKNYRAIIFVVIAFFIGIGLLITGVVTKLFIISLVGFALMFFAAVKGISLIKW